MFTANFSGGQWLRHRMLEVRQVSKSYFTPRGALDILSGVSLSLSRGDAAAIMGPSGSGKSTLLYILGALEPPTSGTVTLDGHNPFELPEKALAAFRNTQVGFVFQDHCLLPQCTVLENVLVPTLVADSRSGAEQRARSLLDQVGLKDRMDHRPGELSGGEQQRVAIARALIRKPLMLLCDEPTGNLDHGSAETVASILLDLHRSQRTILVVVTHNAELASKFPLRLVLAGRHLNRV
jgi:lipoprotein-releasing system ATP-binding protein